MRLSSDGSWGSEETPFPPPEALDEDVAVAFASDRRTVCRLEKYSAEPTPVRSADGSVPRHSARIGDGPEARVRIVERSVAVAVVDGGACCRRVLRRSAGWRMTAEERPERPPERKWDDVRSAKVLVRTLLPPVVEEGEEEDDDEEDMAPTQLVTDV